VTATADTIRRDVEQRLALLDAERRVLRALRAR
jgi:hypothetical protein